LFEWNPAVDARDFVRFPYLHIDIIYLFLQVFVYENNIYYQPDIELHHGSALAITTTGNSRKYHGVANWVYEGKLNRFTSDDDRFCSEEIFASSKALWWSKSGRYLAFASFDDKNITSVKLPRYDASLSYPHYDEIVYPKPGARQQPAVFLWIWYGACL
jgi:dipeptidyl aminopeptidase